MWLPTPSVLAFGCARCPSQARARPVACARAGGDWRLRAGDPRVSRRGSAALAWERSVDGDPGYNPELELRAVAKCNASGERARCDLHSDIRLA